MSEEDFDLIAYAKGRSVAKDEVELFLDEDSASKASRLLRRNDKGKPMGVPEENREEFEALSAKVDESKVTIYLQGLMEGRLEAIRDAHKIELGSESDSTDDDFENWLISNLTEMHVKTVRADGKSSSTKYDEEKWKAFRDVCPNSQWWKLLSKVRELTVVAAVIDDSVDPGFLANS